MTDSGEFNKDILNISKGWERIDLPEPTSEDVMSAIRGGNILKHYISQLKDEDETTRKRAVQLIVDIQNPDKDLNLSDPKVIPTWRFVQKKREELYRKTQKSFLEKDKTTNEQMLSDLQNFDLVR